MTISSRCIFLQCADTVCFSEVKFFLFFPLILAFKMFNLKNSSSSSSSSALDFAFHLSFKMPIARVLHCHCCRFGWCRLSTFSTKDFRILAIPPHLPLYWLRDNRKLTASKRTIPILGDCNLEMPGSYKARNLHSNAIAITMKAKRVREYKCTV